MQITIFTSDGAALNAKVEIEDGAVIVHSRGGAFGKSNLRNPDYRQALRAIIERLNRGGAVATGVWLDSRIAKSWPEFERLVLKPEEFKYPIDQILTLIGKRGAEKGRPADMKGHGNSTKRVRIGILGISRAALQNLLSVDADASGRLPAHILRQVKPTMIDAAIEDFKAGAEHNFQESKDYDLILSSGERLPPKAVFGIALSKVINRLAKPTDFAAGLGELCFNIIEDAGYPIVLKDQNAASSIVDADDERSWAEGTPTLVQHLRRERAPGIAQMKKRRFIEQHGHLFCERCNVIPSQSLGPFGDSCIEVHHSTIAVADMNEKTRTRLADLKCLCANCHRIVHREQSLKLSKPVE